MIYHVNGTVNSSNTEYFNCLTFSKLKIRVYSVGYDTLTEIGNTVVDSDGTFSTEIDSDKSSVIVKLFYMDTAPTEVFVEQSETFCFHDAMSIEFHIDESKYTRDLYSVIIERITDKCFVPSAVTMQFLKDEEIKKISCLTCISEALIRRFQAAYRLYSDSLGSINTPPPETEASINTFYDHPEISLPLLFSVLDSNYTISLEDAFTYSETQFTEKIDNAIDKNEIESSLSDTANIDMLVDVRNGILLSLYSSGYYDAILIHLSNNTYVNKNILLNDALDGGGLSAIISEDPLENSGSLNKLIPLITLDRHLMHFPPLLHIAVNNIDIGNDPDYHELTLAGPDLWEGIITSYPAPYESVEEYALAIYQSISGDKPSARLSKNLDASSITDASALKAVLDSNRSFNIEEHSVASFFSTVDTDPNYLEPSTMLKMQSLQRSVKLSGDTENLIATKAMLDNELTSSYAITRKGKAEFADMMFSAGIPKERGEKIYCRAAAMNSTISMLMAQYKRYESADAQLPFSLKNPDYAGDPLPNLPDLESLFGNLDTCNCSECQSVYSPAAYLTDLLHWLGTSVVCTPVSSGRTGFRALMQTNYVFGSKDRRKDIRYLKLNCKNTNTLVPYIDLVNEILSVNLLMGLPGYTAPDVINAYKTLQTTKTAEELLTEPEHRFPDAEALLKTNYFQWALPYDAAYDESTSYLKKLNKPYADLILDFSSETDQYHTAEWANAFIGLNPTEAALITTAQDTDLNFWKKFWGIVSADLIDNLVLPATPGVGAVLKSADISLAELQDILSAYYINGLAKIEIVPFAGDECDVDKYTFLPKFTTEVADRFMRFLRLKRKTGLSTTELDLSIFNNSTSGDIDQAFLVNLASCMAFAENYNLKFTDVQLFFSDKGYTDLFTFTTNSEYFKNKFLNPLLPSDVIEFFTTDVFSIHVNALTNEDKQKLSKVFKVSIPMLEAILSLTLSGNPELDITHLAIIDRYNTFMKIFGVTEVDFQSVMDHIGNPFSFGWNMNLLWEMSRVFDSFRTLKISLPEFISIVGLTGIYDVGSADLQMKAEELWNKIETAYRKERLAHPEKEFDTVTPYLPTGTLDLTYFEDVIAENLRLPFGLNFQDAKDIVNTYSPTWLEEYVADPEGKDAPRDWPHRAIHFLPLYQLLNRIALLTTLYGMDAGGISKAVDAKIRTSLTLPDDYFNWLTDDPYPIDLGMLLWTKKAMDQAVLLDISQADYFDLVENYNADHSTYYTSLDDTKIIALYNSLGDDSAYKDLSVFEFTQTFLRAKIIAIGTDTPNIVFVLNTFDQIFRTVKSLGYNVADSWSWVWNSGSTAIIDVAAFSSDIRRVLHNKYTNFKTWSDVIVPIQNELRSRLRDALVALYIGTRGFKNENAIYAYYLLDTQMAPCNQTSRVVSAVSSAQLLVHRALLGIEVDVCMDEDDKNEWEWRKNYRVWEANRKVFLYPENWIDPSLRTNKTSIFKATEDLLQQDEINQQNSELAFAGYLTGLNDVAHLDIRATYIEAPENTTAEPCKTPSNTLHVFARSWNAPYIHYYRTLKNNVWTAWEKMELETDSDHLIPVMFNRKLYLFFPLFIEKQHRVIKTVLNGESVNSPYLEIKMCYTKRDFGKWSNKKVLDGTLQAGTISSANIPNTEAGLINKLRKKLEVPGDINSKPVDCKNEKGVGTLLWSNDTITNYTYTSLKKESFYFWPEVQTTGDLRIHCRRDYNEYIDNYHDGYTHMANEWGFLIGACDEKVKIVPPVPANEVVSRPYMTLPYFEQMKKGKDYGAVVTNDAGLWVKREKGHAPLSDKLFKQTNGDYVLTYPQQYLHNITGQPFFYADDKHSLFIDASKKVSLNEHPFTCKMLEALNRFGIEGLLNSKEAGELRRQASSTPFFVSEYSPAATVPTPYPIRDYDFSSSGAYSIYNWEVFFHTVSLIARQLRQSNKYEDALKWINYIFDPANRDMSLQDLRYWKIKPFLIDVTKGISYYMRLLSAPNLNAAEREEKRQWEEQIEIWRDHPFDPHLIASMRPRAYMLWTVMELIDILSDWGDYLFRQDTTESINEAINLYVLASEILGERPKKVDRPAPPEYSYDDIIGGLSAFSNASARFENYMTGLRLCKCENGVLVDEPCDNSPALTTLPELTFCIPDNPRMTEMWDRVEDRLFKIRNCMNIDGKKRQLALFAPPIDPALLVRATAMGLDLSDVLSDLAAAPPHYRFSYLLQRANDFTNEVKSLGSQLLTALEKKDGEELSVLRQIHEQNILKASRTLKEMQLEEARQNYTTLEYSKNLIQIRLDDYKNREYQNSREENAQRQTQLAEGLMYGAQSVRLVAGFLNLIPDLHAGVTALTTLPGGEKFSILTNTGASALEIISSVNRNKASMSLTYAGYDRRQEEWNLQIKSATEELLQIDRQLLSAEIRIAIAEKELENHDLQVEQSAEIYDWLRSKYTNQALYTWMAGQLKTLHRKAYDLAYDLAKQAQQAFFRDLGIDDAPKINFGNWDSSRAGFFAGERLSIQLKELETSYIQHNTRDYELSKNISLALLDPSALEVLRATGQCKIKLPEVLFDMDYPSHYFRRIKSVGITIPGIAGPYTTVGATLTMTKSSVRKKSTYSTTSGLDAEASNIESIATSSAQNDSGVFELNFRDERYMPFEYKGAVSEWTLELSDIVRQFDFNSISDVIMHMQYTAKEAGSSFASDVRTAFKANLNASFSADQGIYYAINLKHDLPNQWHELKTSGSATVKIPKNRLPYYVQALLPALSDVSVFAYTDVINGSGYNLLVNAQPVILPPVSSSSMVYSGSSATTAIALDTDFIVTVSGVLTPLPLNDTSELVILVKLSV
jgi:hypothetical protein